jgi:hypothetical protein
VGPSAAEDSGLDSKTEQDLISKTTAQPLINTQEIIHVVIIARKNNDQFSSEFRLSDIVNQFVHRFLREPIMIKSIDFVYEENFAQIALELLHDLWPGLLSVLINEISESAFDEFYLR